MRIYFATNRDPDRLENPTNFGSHFSRNGLFDLRFGWADFEEGSLDDYTLRVAPEKLEVSAEKEAVRDYSEQVLGSDEVFAMIKREMREQCLDCMIFIHGFNVGFRDALESAARIKDFYKEREMVFVVFTWPSDGKKFLYKPYVDDRIDARASGTALGRGMQKLAHFLRGTVPEAYCGQSIHLMAHSMGNYALRHAVQKIRESAGRNIRRLLDQVLLFAADEDRDAFADPFKLTPLIDMAKQVTIYHNPDDYALIVSDYTKGNPDRLGASGPLNARELPDNVSVVNCDPVVGHLGDLSQHQYYRLNETVRKDVLAVLDGVKPGDVTTRRYNPMTRTFSLLQE